MAAPIYVLDSSAVLALFNTEPGWPRVAEILTSSALSTVNAAEVFSKLDERGFSYAEIERFNAVLEDHFVAYDADLARRTGTLRASTRKAGLSLGDRACLALAQRLGVPVVTADKAWSKIKIDVKIELIRQ